MGLLDELLKAQKPKRNLMGTQMVKGPDQPYLRQDYPGLYGALGGLLATAPDVMEGSVLDPNTAAMRQGAEYTFPVGTALAMLPAARFTKGLPVGMGIKDVGKKNIDVSLNNSSNFLSAKSEFGQVGGTIRPADTFSDKPYLQINYAEVEKASRGMGKGKELYQSLIDDAQARGLRVFSDSTVEKPAVNVYKSLGKKDYELRDMTKGSLEDGSVYGAGAKNPAFEILPRQSPYPQQAALDLAQQRAALPVSEGGLGLPAGNTAEQRAAAMGGKDMVHFSRAGGDYTTLDSGKFAIAPFDAVGTHVGTPQAAMERFQNTVGYKVNNPNYANDELRGASYPVTILGDRPLMNQNGMPFGEDDLNALLRQQGGHNWSDLQGGKMTYQDMNANLRKKLFEDQGYTSIPYFNEVEGKGSISYIVPPENIRSRFAAFDPFRRSAAIAATMGVAAPDLLASPIDEEELLRRQSGLLYAP